MAREAPRTVRCRADSLRRSRQAHAQGNEGPLEPRAERHRSVPFASNRLLLESADVRDQSVYLVWRQISLKRGHILLHATLLRVDAIRDGLLPRVIALRLIRGGGHVLNLHLLTLVGISLASLTVAGGALRFPQALALLVHISKRERAEDKRATYNQSHGPDALHV